LQTELPLIVGGLHLGLSSSPNTSSANVTLDATRELEPIRRPLAIGGTLTRADTESLLNACAGLLAQRAAIVRTPDELGPTWTGLGGLNELARIVNGRSVPSTAPVSPCAWRDGRRRSGWWWQPQSPAPTGVNRIVDSD
jgi:hypothetical protein